MWSRRRLTAALGASLVLPAAAQFRVEISGVGATQIPVALGPFRGEAPGMVSLSSVIRGNLERSGVFRSLDAPAGLDERSRLPQAEVRAQGADALLAGSVNRLADGTFDVRYRLWDAVKGTEVLARAVTVPAADLRLAAHRIADEVFEALTGDKGVFATRIAYVTRSGRQFALHITDADGEGGQVALRSSEPIISPAWSPNGREIAYVSFESQKAVVWVQDVATGKRTMVANFKGSNSAPAWSPDGRTLAVALTLNGLSQIYLINAVDGANARRLTTSNAIDTEPVFSPDGRTLFFTSDRGGSPQIYRMPASGGDATRVTFGSSYNVSPRVSPDGRSLAFLTRRDGRYFVGLKDLGSGGNESVLTDGGQEESPSFAPNGRWIMYATQQGGRDSLMATSVDGRVKQRLSSSLGDIREPSWGPFLR